MNNLQVTEFEDVRVLTTPQLAESYGTDTRIISNNFNRNKDRFREGKHYIILQGEEKRGFIDHHQIDDGSKNATVIYLWTEKGCLLHAKSLGTDKAWEVYEELIDTYFRVKQSNPFKPLSTLEIIELQLKAIQEVDTKIDTVNTDLQDFKKDMPLLALECDRITTAARRIGVSCLGSKESEAYQDKSIRAKVYADIYEQLKREFGVTSYKAIKRSQCDLAVSIINNYRLPLALSELITGSNAQIRLVI